MNYVVEQNLVNAVNSAQSEIINVIKYIGIILCSIIASLLLIWGVVSLMKILLNKNSVVDKTSSAIKIGVLFGAGTIFSTIASSLFVNVSINKSNALYIIGTQTTNTVSEYVSFVIGVICSISSAIMIIYALTCASLIFINRHIYDDINRQIIKVVSFLILGALLAFIGSSNVKF